jgi:hypothetical protein
MDLYKIPRFFFQAVVKSVPAIQETQIDELNQDRNVSVEGDVPITVTDFPTG